jgi:hypothetical protein
VLDRLAGSQQAGVESCSRRFLFDETLMASHFSPEACLPIDLNTCPSFLICPLVSWRCHFGQCLGDAFSA